MRQKAIRIITRGVRQLAVSQQARPNYQAPQGRKTIRYISVMGSLYLALDMSLNQIAEDITSKCKEGDKDGKSISARKADF